MKFNSKMFSKIFLSIILLKCVYTYMLKINIDNNDTNFRKLPENLNYELNEIQTVKPNLSSVLNMMQLKAFITTFFGRIFMSKLEQYSFKDRNIGM